MRPTRLELAGFTAFREPVVVDFTGADLFALTGPTGSGKSSVIDALTFALYGSVPRYDDRRVVAPVITQGRNEARVRYDFTVADQSFTAVRVVRRTAAGGATTKEARLERHGGEVVAGDADAVSQSVERLLGLPFDHFTTCVVLPQGAFARFLHETPSRRQDLLVRLLDLGVYERVARDAGARARQAAQRAGLLDEQLEGLAGATPGALADVRDRLRRLDRLAQRVASAQPRLEALTARSSAARDEAGRATAVAQTLERLRPPEGADEIARRLRGAADDERLASDAARAAAEAAETATAVLETLPARADLRAAAADHAERARRRSELAEADRTAARAAEAERSAAAARDRIEAEGAAAAAALDDARRSHSAADLARGLSAGDSCPVCGQRVAETPPTHGGVDLDALEAAAAAARERWRSADEQRQTAAQARAAGDRDVVVLRRRLDELDAALADRPPSDDVAASLERLDAAEAAAGRARADARAAARRRDAARHELEQARGDERRGWEAFQAARDVAAGLDPPTAEGVDLAGAWERLVSWARSEGPTRRDAAARARDAAARADAERAALVGELVAACQQEGVDAGDDGGAAAAVDRATVRAEAVRQRLQEDRERADRLRRERTAAHERGRTAQALARHLDARGFKQWLVDEALDVLVTDGSARLRELSSGQYSLARDARANLQVVDHRNADERRPAKTLSGGETFLASLALALALAERLAELAVHRAARLEAIFLDEGFGTLDAATLDTVATAVEELGTGGRTVGLVTHVRELAERVPVRYEVRKGPQTSTVERVDR